MLLGPHFVGFPRSRGSELARAPGDTRAALGGESYDAVRAPEVACVAKVNSRDLRLLWGAAPGPGQQEAAVQGRAESERAGGGRLAGNGAVSPMGKRDPASSLAAFPVSQVPAPVRRRQRSPEGETSGGWQTWKESALWIRIAGIVTAAGAAKTQVHSFRTPA